MKPLFLIFALSTTFLSSCSIDWNDTKDMKIKELETQVNLSTNKIKELEASLQDTTIRLQAVNSLYDAKSKEYEVAANAVKEVGEYTKASLDGENTGFCVVGGESDLDATKKEITEKCKQENIILNKTITKSGYRCMLNPNGDGYAFINPEQLGFTPLGEYYHKTQKYILFFYKVGDYCYQILDNVDIAKFRVEKLDDLYWKGEYGTDGKKYYSVFGIFDSKTALKKYVTAYFIQDAKDRGYPLTPAP